MGRIRRPRALAALATLGTVTAVGLAALPAGVALGGGADGARRSPRPGVTVQSATLRGAVNPRSLATTYFFQYGPTAAYGAQTAPTALAAGAAAVTCHARGRRPRPGRDLPLPARRDERLGHLGHGRPDVPHARAGAARRARRERRTRRPSAGRRRSSGPSSGTGAAGRPVQIQQRAFPFAGGFANVGNALVDRRRAAGSRWPSSRSRVTTQFRARVTDRAGIVSPVLPVGARAVVGTRVTSTNVRRGGRVHFSGTVRPSEPGRGIAIQKRRDGRWITVAGTVARPGGGAFAIYGKTIRVPRGGLYRVFLGTGSGATVPNVGRTIRIRTHR